LTLSAEEKEKLKQNRLENLRRGREKAKATKDSSPSPAPQVTEAVDNLVNSVTGELGKIPVVANQTANKPLKNTSHLRFSLWKTLLGGVGIVLGILILILGNTSTNTLLIAIALRVAL